MLRNLPVVGASIGTDGILAIYNPRLMHVFCDSYEFKAAVREKDVVHDMLKQGIFNRMLFKMGLGKWILDLVIDLFRLHHPHFTLAGAYCISGAGDISHVNKASGSLRRRN
jgi:hypothetical protein